MDNLIKLLNIDEHLEKGPKRPKEFTTVKSQTSKHEDFNFMLDLLILPKTKDGYRYLLVAIDLTTDEFDIEPLKTKTPTETLMAFKTITKRKYLNIPKRSIQTDGGKEFLGDFHKYLYNKSIYHSVAKKGRHTQMANVERLNRTLGRLIVGYLNSKERETKHLYREWVEILSTIRTELNKHRVKRLKKLKPKKEPKFTIHEPKFKIGDTVRYLYDIPHDVHGHPQSTQTFREGDTRWSFTTHKINIVDHTGGSVMWRYVLDGRKGVSYTAKQLKKVTEKETTYVVKKIIDRAVVNDKINYLVWWETFLKKDATWHLKTELIKDGVKTKIDEYEAKKK